MSTDIKFSKAQISKKSQSGGSFCSWSANLGKKWLTNNAISLARYNLPALVSNSISNAINKFWRKTRGKGAVRAGKRLTLFILNEDMNNIIKITKSLEDSAVLIDEVTETVKHEIKEQESVLLGALLAPLVASLVQPVISSLIIALSKRGVRIAGTEYMDKNV